MCSPIDHQRTRSADSFATVVIKNDCVFVFADKSLVQLIEHFKKRCLIADTFNNMRLKLTDRVWTVLAPNFKLQVSQVLHL